MAQYAIIQHLDQKLQKTENFYLATIFKVKHRMSSYISIFLQKDRSVRKFKFPLLVLGFFENIQNFNIQNQVKKYIIIPA